MAPSLAAASNWLVNLALSDASSSFSFLRAVLLASPHVWVCESMSPGSSVFPLPSIMIAPNAAFP
jgi:hypothetical protein